MGFAVSSLSDGPSTGGRNGGVVDKPLQKSVATSSTPQDEYAVDDWVDEMVHHSTDVPRVVVIFGFVGKAAKKDHLRIYLTPSLTYLCEIPRAAIVQRIPLRRDQFPLGGSYF